MYSFRYSVTKEDYAAFNIFACWADPVLTKVRLQFFFKTLFMAALILAGTNFFLQLDPRLRSNNRIADIILVISIAVVIAALSYYSTPAAQIRKRVGNMALLEINKQIFEEGLLTIDENVITLKSTSQTMELKWTGILKAAGTKDYFFLFISSVHGLIIPKRIFGTNDEIISFEKFLSVHLQSINFYPGLKL